MIDAKDFRNRPDRRRCGCFFNSLINFSLSLPSAASPSARSALLRTVSRGRSSLRKAYWTRIGSLVLVQGTIQWTNRTASADVVRITLPFTSANDAQFRSSVTIGFSSGVALGTAQENITGAIAQNEAFWTMQIYNQFTSSMGNYLVSYLFTAGEIQFSIAYHMNI